MIDVNLHDCLFTQPGNPQVQAPSATAWATPATVRYVRGQMTFAGPTVFTDGHLTHADLVQRVQAPVKIAWMREPACLWPETYAQVPAVAHLFTRVLTHHRPFLQTIPNAVYVPYGGVWIAPRHWGLPPRKTNHISMLVGTKTQTVGHRIRQEAAAAIERQFAGLVDLFGPAYRPVNYSPATKRLLTESYRFAIVAETCAESGLFTEITLDCFALGCIPILWGCPDIGRWFNPDGIIHWATVDDLARILPTLTAALYASRRAAVADNLARVAEYRVIEDWLSARGLLT